MISRDSPYAAAWFSTGTLCVCVCVCVCERLGESAAWNQMEFSQNQTDLQTIEIKSLFLNIPLCVQNKHYLPHDSLGGEVTEPKWISSNNWIITPSLP